MRRTLSRSNVHEYETLHPGQCTLETHLNYVGGGTKNYEGRLAKNLVWSFGVGIGMTPAGERLVCKSRSEFTFGPDH